MGQLSPMNNSLGYFFQECFNSKFWTKNSIGQRQAEITVASFTHHFGLKVTYVHTDAIGTLLLARTPTHTICLHSFGSCRARIPVASQVTALEIWLLACILLVFGALAEYAFILRKVIQLSRKQQRRRQLFNQQISKTSGAISSRRQNRQHLQQQEQNYHEEDLQSPMQLDVFSPNAGLLSKAQKEAVESEDIMEASSAPDNNYAEACCQGSTSKSSKRKCKNILPMRVHNRVNSLPEGGEFFQPEVIRPNAEKFNCGSCNRWVRWLSLESQA